MRLIADAVPASRVLMLLLMLLVPTAAADAQRAANGPPEARRALLEQRLEQRMQQEFRQRLQLGDDQMRQLRLVMRRLSTERRGLREQERDTRQALRQQTMLGDRADQQQVATLLDRMLTLQRQRLTMVESEQRDLAKFLTPVQRAGYLALQDQMRRILQEAQRERRAGEPSAGRAGGPARPR